jgi:PAS domain S-box-containing protein
MGRKPIQKEKQQKVRKLKKKTVERKPTQEPLGDTSGPLLDLIEALPDAVFFKDVRGRHLFVNDACAKLAGLGKEKMLGKTDKQLLPPDLAEQCALSDKEAMNLRKPVRFEESMTDAEGKKTFLETIKVPFLDKRGDVAGLVGVSRDITERKQAEREARLMQYCVKHASDAVFWVDKNARFIYVNNSACRHMGYSREELLSMKVHDVDPLYQEDNWPDFWRQFKDKGSLSFESVNRSKDGREFPVKITVSYLEYEDEQIMHAYVRDITSRKKAQDALQKSHEDLKAHSESLEDLNTALKVLLERREKDKVQLEESVVSNVQELILPYVETLRGTRLDEKQMTCVDIIESNLKEIVSPFLQKLVLQYSGLTPKEIQIAGLIKQGKTTKDIANLFNVSTRTVKFHRENIRAKLGLKKQRTNLASHLLSLP